MHQAELRGDAVPQAGAETRPAQMGATPDKPVKAPVQAAFGTSSGAVVFRDFASI
jgi:hypothetical protein